MMTGTIVVFGCTACTTPIAVREDAPSVACECGRGSWERLSPEQDPVRCEFATEMLLLFEERYAGRVPKIPPAGAEPLTPSRWLALVEEKIAAAGGGVVNYPDLWKGKDRIAMPITVRKPWEESWFAHKDCVVGAGWRTIFAPHEDSASDLDSMRVRAELAAAAPEMARALLAIDDAIDHLKSRADSFGANPDDTIVTTAEGLLDGALRKAGVR